MHRLLTPLGAASIVLTGLLPVGTRAAPPPPPPPGPSVSILSPTRPVTVTRKHPAVTFRVKVVGLRLSAAHMGKKPVKNEGHLQVYADRIPADAYKKKDFRTTWLAALAARKFPLKLATPILTKGRHKILIALAQDNYVLYKANTASVTVIVK